jgi:hypothetical protein
MRTLDECQRLIEPSVYELRSDSGSNYRSKQPVPVLFPDLSAAMRHLFRRIRLSL